MLSGFKKNAKAIIVRVQNFPVSSNEYFYAMLLLLLPHRNEKDFCEPFDSYKEAFMHKHKTLIHQLITNISLFQCK